MEEILASLGEFFLEESTLEKLWIRKLAKHHSFIFLVQCPKATQSSTLNIMNALNNNPMTIALNPINSS